MLAIHFGSTAASQPSQSYVVANMTDRSARSRLQKRPQISTQRKWRELTNGSNTEAIHVITVSHNALRPTGVPVFLFTLVTCAAFTV